MTKASRIKATEKTSTTSNPYRTGGPTTWPMPEPYPLEEIEVFPEMLMVVLKTKQVNENVRQRPSYDDDATYRPGAFAGLFKDQK